MARPSDRSNTRRDRYGADAGRRFQEHSEQWIDTHDAASHAPGADDDPTRPDDAVSIDEVVERLSRDMSDAVNRAPIDERDELRAYATELVREDTAPPGVIQSMPPRRGTLSFFAVAVWLAVAGAVLYFIIPGAGVVCFVLAGIAAALAAIFGPGNKAPTIRLGDGRRRGA